ncbi:uncharacterized protein LOC142985795 [Anticarsia gemmatalis]|uniref:uncharacterized protein LOC142985795 n=1 Tax=Anticarsia gemmatalis TaxID=129554 RepID=UPI003F760213
MTQRSPPKTLPQLVTLNTSAHYNSDSAINKVILPETEDNYFNITIKRTLEDPVQQPQSSLSEIKAMFIELKAQHDNKYELLNNALMTIITQNQDIQKTVVTLTNNHKELLTKITSLEQENKEQKQLISTLEIKLDFIEKSTRSSTLEVRNIPKQDNESKQTLVGVIKHISSKLCHGQDTPIRESDTRDIYRSKSATIVVTFNSTLHMESLITQLKTYNKNKREHKESSLNTGDLQLSGPSRPIFLSEYLTSKARRIFYVAREHVKNRKLVAAWTVHRKIYIKKCEDSMPVRINEESDLSKIML